EFRGGVGRRRRPAQPLPDRTLMCGGDADGAAGDRAADDGLDFEETRLRLEAPPIGDCGFRPDFHAALSYVEMIGAALPRMAALTSSRRRQDIRDRRLHFTLNDPRFPCQTSDEKPSNPFLVRFVEVGRVLLVTPSGRKMRIFRFPGC